MGRFIILLLGFCTLHLASVSRTSVEASVTPWMTNDTRWSGRRTIRSADRPKPISCKMGIWSSWTRCDSCTESKLRFRYLNKPSQFGGTHCIETLWDRLACPTATTQCLVPDYCGESFTCKYTGRCISQSLRCNGEGDCSDFSDEDNCADYNPRKDKCSTLLPIPGAERGTQGFSVLTGDFVDQVLDPHYFGGTCEYVYNGEWRKFLYESFCENLQYDDDSKNYRKPYNYHSYRFVAEAASEGSYEYYEDVNSLLKARKRTHSSNAGVTVAVYYVQVGVKGSTESEFLTNITQYKSQDVGFVRLFSKVQTALFKMRSNNLMLHEDFYYALMELPEEYDFGMYSRFFKMFGTHYVTEGTMGGTLEYVVVVNKNTMAESKMEGSQVGRCIGGSVGLSSPLGAYGSADLTVGGSSCNKNGEFNRVSDGDSVDIKDIVTLVKGGILHASSGLLAIRNPETYRKWGASLKYNPTLIDYETLPIYELVRRSTAAAHVGQRLANLQKGWEEYQRHFDSCRCESCKHSGIAVLAGTSCECNCRSGYQGVACEETLRRDTKTDGSWSCWGFWSSCASGRKTRTRTCNNPPPTDGGATCQGSASQTQHC